MKNTPTIKKTSSKKSYTINPWHEKKIQKSDSIKFMPNNRMPRKKREREKEKKICNLASRPNRSVEPTELYLRRASKKEIRSTPSMGNCLFDCYLLLRCHRRRRRPSTIGVDFVVVANRDRCVDDKLGIFC